RAAKLSRTRHPSRRARRPVSRGRADLSRCATRTARHARRVSALGRGHAEACAPFHASRLPRDAKLRRRREARTAVRGARLRLRPAAGPAARHRSLRGVRRVPHLRIRRPDIPAPAVAENRRTHYPPGTLPLLRPAARLTAIPGLITGFRG